ncbi:RecQ-mediated genome instability protein 1 [Chionoecetes opilio]|uniref:RecQ-mediated genome instability protein 1 n=1 Tax=Chionoecetes opilio TaxID=41210 RepID=A0A8J4YS17_CHIOP|nr:RecQ-mediated genome instability protein 1 [Chionoecetes opilio]
MHQVVPVKRYLSTRHITVPEDWLTACVEWALTEYAQRNVSFIQEKVYQEWLHADLTELATSCLPPQIQDQLSTTISGHFPLQITSIRDISEPAYGQLLKVEGADTENTTVSATQDYRTARERKPERMLMLQLSDGTTRVEGMEYRPASNLNINLSPGTKVLVFGSIKVRRGILFLTQQNITVLGGKVVDLIEANNQRNTLMAALNNRDTDDQEQRWIIDNEEQPDNHEEPQTGSRTNRGAGGTRSQNDNEGNEIEEPEALSLQEKTVSNGEEELDFFDDDEIFESGFDEEFTLEEESVQDRPLNKNLPKTCQSMSLMMIWMRSCLKCDTEYWLPCWSLLECWVNFQFDTEFTLVDETIFFW